MPTPYSPGRGQRETQAGRFALKKSVRNLNQDSRAVARLRIAAACAAMRQIDQDLDALQDDIVRLAALDAGHKTDAASVVLMLRAGTVPGPAVILEMDTVPSYEPGINLLGLAIG